MMRQYELVERVQRYKPDVNEALLNKAYVYAMQKHGQQKRASRRSLFLASARSRRDPHRHAARRGDDRGRAAARHDRGHRPPPAHEIDELFGPEIGKLVEGLTKLKKLDLVSQEGRAGGEPAQAAAGDLRGRARAAGQARRPAAQHAHARPRAGRTSALRIAEETMEIYAPLAGRMGMQDMREELEELAFRYINPDAYRTVTERLAEVFERNARRRSARSRRRSRRCSRSTASRPTVKSRQKKPWSMFRKMETQGAVLRAALRHLRLPRRRRHGRGLLPRARRRPHDLVDGARPLQGLHLDAEAERLPLDPHHHRRPVAPARRAADPHRAR